MKKRILLILMLNLFSLKSLASTLEYDNDIIRQEFAEIGFNSSLSTVSSQSISELLKDLPNLSIKQRELGFNSWSAANILTGRSFHEEGSHWSQEQFDIYYKNGILREIFFLLTGVSSKNNRTTEILTSRGDFNLDIGISTRILLSLYSEMKLFSHRGQLVVNVNSVMTRILNKKNLFQKANSDQRRPVALFNISNNLSSSANLSPARISEFYELDYQMLEFEDSYLISGMTFYIEHMMKQLISILETDPLLINLATKFHKQKLIEEGLSRQQYARMTSLPTDQIVYELIGKVFERERNLAEAYQRLLFFTISDKILYVLKNHILNKSVPEFIEMFETLINLEPDAAVVEFAASLDQLNLEEIQSYTPSGLDEVYAVELLGAEYF